VSSTRDRAKERHPEAHRTDGFDLVHDLGLDHTGTVRCEHVLLRVLPEDPVEEAALMDLDATPHTRPGRVAAPESGGERLFAEDRCAPILLDT